MNIIDKIRYAKRKTIAIVSSIICIMGVVSTIPFLDFKMDGILDAIFNNEEGVEIFVPTHIPSNVVSIIDSNMYLKSEYLTNYNIFVVSGVDSIKTNTYRIIHGNIIEVSL